MNLDEAIKGLEQSKNWYEYHNVTEQVEAHKLGIEALKFRLMCEKRKIRFATLPLPGETEV